MNEKYLRYSVKATAERLPRALGAVIVFTPGTNQHDAERALRTLVRQGVIRPDTRVNEFDPDHGGPVWYIP